jgi:hypothetical protein
MESFEQLRRLAAVACVLVAGLFLLMPLCGCLVGGYSSATGWYVWPGSIVITLLMLLFFFLRRGR